MYATLESSFLTPSRNKNSVEKCTFAKETKVTTKNKNKTRTHRKHIQ